MDVASREIKEKMEGIGGMDMNAEVVQTDPDSSPEKSLWCAVIGTLISDFRDGRESYSKVENWLNSRWGQTVCDMAGTTPEYIYRKIFVEGKIVQDTAYDKYFTIKCRLERDICMAKDGTRPQKDEVIKAMENQLKATVNNMESLKREHNERVGRQMRMH